MSTRSVLYFGGVFQSEVQRAQHSISALIYRHYDGYPGDGCGVLYDLRKFFEACVEETGNDTRFNDPSYLAAKFVYWQAHQHMAGKTTHYKEMLKRPDISAEDTKYYKKRMRENKAKGYLDFLGVGVLMEEPGDIEYRYFVCSPDSGFGVAPEPTVAWEKVRYSEKLKSNLPPSHEFYYSAKPLTEQIKLIVAAEKAEKAAEELQKNPGTKAARRIVST